MIRLLCKELLQSIVSSDAAAATRPSSISIARFSSTTTTTSGGAPSIAPSHLIDTYNLSPDKALSISNIIHLRKTSRNPHRLLSFLKDHGFTAAQIVTTLTKRPLLLSIDPDKFLKRRWDFFQYSLGLSPPDIANLLSRTPALFELTLRKNPTPPIKDTNPNFETLRDFGIPHSHIIRFIQHHPRALLTTPDRFKAVVAEVKETGFSPSALKFTRAVGILCCMGGERLERKRARYRTLGWSDQGILRAFRAQPNLFSISDDTIKQKIDFLLNKIGMKPASLLASPVLLLCSLKKRLEPRYSVLKILMSRGLLKKNEIAPWMLAISEKDFRTKYVERYEKEVPEVVEASQSNTELVDSNMESQEEGDDEEEGIHKLIS